jgi:hypothetical protein
MKEGVKNKFGRNTSTTFVSMVCLINIHLKALLPQNEQLKILTFANPCLCANSYIYEKKAQRNTFRRKTSTTFAC